MAVFVVIRQDKRKQSNNLWYGRTFNPNIIDTHGLFMLAVISAYIAKPVKWLTKTEKSIINSDSDTSDSDIKVLPYPQRGVERDISIL